MTDPAELAHLEYLKSFCEVGIQAATEDVPQLFGCTCCPPFQECPPHDDGSVVENPDHVYIIDGIARGRFSRKDADQDLVTLRGCGVSMNGGSVLVLDSKDGKRTTALYEECMVVPAKCEPYRLRDGHDLAVCERVTTNQSHFRVHIVAGDFMKPEQKRWQEIVEFYDGGVAACFGPPGESFQRETVVQRGFADANGDGRLELAIDVDSLRAVSSQPFIDACVAWLEAGPTPRPSTPPPWVILERPHRDRFTFLHDGASFVATPASKRILGKRSR